MAESDAASVRYTTLLDGLSVTMGLGIHPHEATPQRVIVSVRMTVAYPAPVAEDRIEDVLDYDFLRDGIHRLAATRHFGLQETLCDAIAALCLADARVEEVRVQTAKPDIYPDAAIGCAVTRRRPG